jgi:hypothetical protein
MTMRKLTSILGICLLTAACTAGGAGSPTPVPRYDVATGAGDLILRIDSGGGLVPMSYQLTHMPVLALYGDGRIIVQGPMIEIYPGPLLPNLRQMRVTPAEIQKIVAAADQAGLLGPDASYDATNINDAGTTIFTTTVAGKTHRISAYALFESGMVDDDAIAKVRERLLTFQGQMSALSTFLGREVSDTEAYVPTSMQVFTAPIDPANDVDPDGLTRQVVAWPLAVDPATAGQPTVISEYRCLALSGSDLVQFGAVATSANTLTVWTYGGERYSVMVRPLYPDESGCHYGED